MGGNSFLFFTASFCVTCVLHKSNTCSCSWNTLCLSILTLPCLCCSVYGRGRCPSLGQSAQESLLLGRRDQAEVQAKLLLRENKRLPFSKTHIHRPKFKIPIWFFSLFLSLYAHCSFLPLFPSLRAVKEYTIAPKYMLVIAISKWGKNSTKMI